MKEGQVGHPTLLTPRVCLISKREATPQVPHPATRLSWLGKNGLANMVNLRTVILVMNPDGSYPEWTENDSPKVSEGTTTVRPVIPLVSREEAERVFSSQRLMSLEESWAQVDKSLGRLNDSE